jgi:hypothetical protein
MDEFASDQQYVAEERPVRCSYYRIENSPHALRLQGLLEGHCSSVADYFPHVIHGLQFTVWGQQVSDFR